MDFNVLSTAQRYLRTTKLSQVDRHPKTPLIRVPVIWGTRSHRPREATGPAVTLNWRVFYSRVLLTSLKQEDNKLKIKAKCLSLFRPGYTVHWHSVPKLKGLQIPGSPYELPTQHFEMKIEFIRSFWSLLPVGRPFWRKQIWRKLVLSMSLSLRTTETVVSNNVYQITETYDYHHWNIWFYSFIHRIIPTLK